MARPDASLVGAHDGTRWIEVRGDGSGVKRAHHEVRGTPIHAVLGWRALLCDDDGDVGRAGSVLGDVRDMRFTGGAGAVNALLVVFDGARNILIPYVEDIVRSLDAQRREVWLCPPEGLLDLDAGDTDVVLHNVRRMLAEYCVRTGADPTQMPKAAELQAAGERGLLRAMRRLGGLAETAEILGMAATCKPKGYWENEALLDSAITDFNLQAFEGHGAETPWGDDKAGEAPEGQRRGPPDSEGLAVEEHGDDGDVWEEDDELLDELVLSELREAAAWRMPGPREVREAGRYDLDGGIRQWGGYTRVADMLGRELERGVRRVRKPERSQRPYPRIRSVEELDALLSDYLVLRENDDVSMPRRGAEPTAHSPMSDVERFGMPVKMPSQGELLAAGRNDLVAAVQGLGGGFGATAARMGLKGARRGDVVLRTNFESFAAELCAFAREVARDTGGDPRRMPTRKEFSARGRGDLLYALAKLGGNEVVAHRLGLSASPRGRPAGSRNGNGLRA